MKTTDLIPFILLELKEHDKYGFELTKAIETKSNGNIVIKQPTLYTVLKKLEKSKFISSYWEDSEIGGKRHYYKITDNGLKQTLTLPSYEELLKSVCGDNFELLANEDVKPQTTATPSNDAIPEEKVFSIFDHLKSEESNPITEQTSVLPSEEVFASTDVDSATDVEINLQNTEILKNEDIQKEEQFANNANVSKFTENIPSVTPTINTLESNEIVKENVDEFNINSLPEAKSYNEIKTEIPYVEFVDLKKDESYISAKRTAKKLFTKMIANSFYLLTILILCSIATSFLGRSKIFYISLIVSSVILVFMPAIFISKFKDIKIKLQKNKLNIGFKKKIIINLSAFMLAVVSIVIINILLNKSFWAVFNLSNFANSYAPMLLCSTLLFDLIFTKIIFSKN